MNDNKSVLTTRLPDYLIALIKSRAKNTRPKSSIAGVIEDALRCYFDDLDIEKENLITEEKNGLQ